MSDDIRMRTRVLALVLRYPGLHVREIARQLGTSVALVEYHLRALAQEGDVELVQDRRFVRAHARGRHAVPAGDRAAVQALRDARGLGIILFLLSQDGPVPHAEIADELSMAKATLSFHLRKLEEPGLVRGGPDGYIVPDAGHVLALLRAYRPTPDLLSRFASLWDRLYD